MRHQAAQRGTAEAREERLPAVRGLGRDVKRVKRVPRRARAWVYGVMAVPSELKQNVMLEPEFIPQAEDEADPVLSALTPTYASRTSSRRNQAAWSKAP